MEKGFIRSECPSCSRINRIEVEFPAFNKPFNDVFYECKCGDTLLIHDEHEYNEDGMIK